MLFNFLYAILEEKQTLNFIINQQLHNYKIIIIKFKITRSNFLARHLQSLQIFHDFSSLDTPKYPRAIAVASARSSLFLLHIKLKQQPFLFPPSETALLSEEFNFFNASCDLNMMYNWLINTFSRVFNIFKNKILSQVSISIKLQEMQVK